LSIALADLASISERRIEHMLDPSVSQLPAFLTSEGGLNSGFMIAHVTSAALVSENKTLCHPASVDSIPTSANKEDHVSMGLFAGRKALQICQNLETILAIELLCACQALDFRAPLKPAKATAAALQLVRSQVPSWQEDRLMHKDIDIAQSLISLGKLEQVVAQNTSDLT
jgi:histidine ammonia-lyase